MHVCMYVCNSLLIGLLKTRLSPFQTVLNAAARPVTPISPPTCTSRNISIGFQSLLGLNIKFYLLFSGPKWGWPLNNSVTPSNFQPLPHPFILYAPWKGGCSLSLGPGQPSSRSFFRYWPFSLESPSTFSSCFSLIIQSIDVKNVFYVFIIFIKNAFLNVFYFLNDFLFSRGQHFKSY